MIKLFRTIRQKLLSENKFGKYIFYAIGEIILVVIGILIALQINNWNENRKNKIEELNVLQEIKGSLLSDIEQLQARIELAKTDIQSADIILNHLENKLEYNDSLSSHFFIITTTGNKVFTPQISAYKVLESKGVDLISNNQLKKEILNLYNIDYPNLAYEYENYHRNIHDYGRPIARTLFLSNDRRLEGDLKLKPIDFESLSTNVVFINTLRIIISNDHSIGEMLNDLIKKCQKIVNEIDAELKK